MKRLKEPTLLRKIIRRLKRWQWWWMLVTAMATSGVLCSLSTSTQLTVRFPSVSPHRLAHFLVDFTNHPRLYPQVGPWSLEEEANNYTSWSYSVRYECGTRCSGKARLELHQQFPDPVRAQRWQSDPDVPPQHGQPERYKIVVAHIQCKRILFFPIPEYCEQWNSEMNVVGWSGDDGELSETFEGSLYSEVSQRRCAAWRTLLGSCADELQASRHDHMLRLRLLLAAETNR